jgi:hypothetical protein
LKPSIESIGNGQEVKKREQEQGGDGSTSANMIYLKVIVVDIPKALRKTIPALDYLDEALNHEWANGPHALKCSVIGFILP